MGIGEKDMTDRTHPDSGRIITSGDVISELQDRIAELESQLAAQPAPSGDAEDAARYRWLRAEHERIDPLCHVVWKVGRDRNGSDWANTASLDADIDAARKEGK
jgi:hypothetical protein